MFETIMTHLGDDRWLFAVLDEAGVLEAWDAGTEPHDGTLADHGWTRTTGWTLTPYGRKTEVAVLYPFD